MCLPDVFNNDTNTLGGKDLDIYFTVANERSYVDQNIYLTVVWNNIIAVKSDDPKEYLRKTENIMYVDASHRV